MLERCTEGMEAVGWIPELGSSRRLVGRGGMVLLEAALIAPRALHRAAKHPEPALGCLGSALHMQAGRTRGARQQLCWGFKPSPCCTHPGCWKAPGEEAPAPSRGHKAWR